MMKSALLRKKAEFEVPDFDVLEDGIYLISGIEVIPANIQYGDPEGITPEVQEFISKYKDTAVAGHAYGVDDVEYLFSSRPPKLADTLLQGYIGMGACAILNNTTGPLYIQFEND